MYFLLTISPFVSWLLNKPIAFQLIRDGNPPQPTKSKNSIFEIIRVGRANVITRLEKKGADPSISLTLSPHVTAFGLTPLLYTNHWTFNQKRKVRGGRELKTRHRFDLKCVILIWQTNIKYFSCQCIDTHRNRHQTTCRRDSILVISLPRKLPPFRQAICDVIHGERCKLDIEVDTITVNSGCILRDTIALDSGHRRFGAGKSIENSYNILAPSTLRHTPLNSVTLLQFQSRLPDISRFVT